MVSLIRQGRSAGVDIPSKIKQKGQKALIKTRHKNLLIFFYARLDSWSQVLLRAFCPFCLHFNPKYESINSWIILVKYELSRTLTFEILITMRQRRFSKVSVRVIHIIYCSILDLYIIMFLCLWSAHFYVFSVGIKFYLFSPYYRLRFRRKNLK